ncbi:hypothetical protein LIA77_07263 [Sarocladium implicatum]|nr:hypothetical protein LIA77_07263 [Sarocladium implicatum]
MAAHQAQHQANQLTQVVHQIRAEAQGFHGQVVLRFDNIDHAIAALQDRYEALSQKTEERHNRMESRLTNLNEKVLKISDSLAERILPAVLQGTRAIQDTLKEQIRPAIQQGIDVIQNAITNQLQPAIIEKVQVVQNTVEAIRESLEGLDLHVVQPISDAVHHTETVILGRIGELQNAMPGAIQANLEQAINSSETRIRERIDHRHQETNVAHNNATSQARDTITTAVVGARDAISARLHHTAELEITYQNVLDAVEATRHEVRAG